MYLKKKIFFFAIILFFLQKNTGFQGFYICYFAIFFNINREHFSKIYSF
jgi:hypothetical protein